MDEDLSAWVDDELDAARSDRLYARLDGDDALRERWDTYHLIGDVLRGSSAAGLARAAFAAKLASEPTVVAPVVRPPVAAPARGRAVSRVASVAAGVAAIGFVGWAAWPTLFGPAVEPNRLVQIPAAPQVVATPVTASTATQMAAPAAPISVPPPKAVADYLLAHNRWSHSLTGGLPYVRIVTEQGPGAAQGAQ